ncbi:MAG: hypothetical protein M1814_001564 [Vezdaea aestivalis]|nr:MAG: hypothetical protein M1814_001564 [Vezdaea aestivalis]
MRAAFRRMRSKSHDGQTELLRVSLYEDATPRVPPTTGLRPLHGSIPDHMREETAQHYRSRSLPPRKEAIQATESAKSPPIPATSYEPIRKDWAVHSLPSPSREPSRSNQFTPRGQDWPLTSPTAPTQSDPQPQRPQSSVAWYNKDIANRNISPPSSTRTLSVRSKVSSLGAAYSEDVADRNISRQQGTHQPRMASTSVDDQSGREDGEQSWRDHGRYPSVNDTQGRQRHTSPYSSAQIYQPTISGFDGHHSQEFRKQPSILRKPVGSGEPRSPPFTSTTPTQLSRRQSMEKPLPLVPGRTDSSRARSRGISTSPRRSAYMTAPPPPVPRLSQGPDESFRDSGFESSRNTMIADRPPGQRQMSPIGAGERRRLSDRSIGAEHYQRNSNVPGPMRQANGSLTRTVDTSVHETIASACVHERFKEESYEIRQEAITRHIHNHDVYHRILPVIDVEVLPPKHYVPTAADGLVEVDRESLPGRQNHFTIVETVSNDPPAPPRFTTSQPYEESSVTYPTGAGYDRTETVIRHPPVFETGARDTGQTWPLSLENRGPERFGIAPAKVPRRNSSMSRHGGPVRQS